MEVVLVDERLPVTVGGQDVRRWAKLSFPDGAVIRGDVAAEELLVAGFELDPLLAIHELEGPERQLAGFVVLFVVSQRHSGGQFHVIE